MTARRQVALIVLAGAAVAHAYRTDTFALVLVGLIVVNLVGAHSLVARYRRAQTSPASFSTPLAACWLVVTILPAHRLSADASSAVSRRLVEFVAFVCVGLVAAFTIRTFESSLQRARPPAFLFLIPIWVISSTVWSGWATEALIYGLEFLTIAILAWASVAVGRADGSAVTSMVGTFLRAFVWITAILTALGVAFGPIYAPYGEAQVGQFTWVAAHPNAAGLLLSVSVIILVASPPRVLRLPPRVVAAFTLSFLIAMYFAHSRSAWACLIAGLLIVLIGQGRIAPRVAWIGVPLAGTIATAALWWNGTALWEYILRDNNTQGLQTGNGRLKLWGVGFRALDTVGDWLIGLGYGASRAVFVAEHDWATHAHNSLLSYLVSLGLIGAGIFLFTLITAGRSLLQGRFWAEPEIGLPMSALLMIVTLNAAATDIMAEPTIGFAVLSLAAAVGIVANRARDDSSAFTEDQMSKYPHRSNAARKQITRRHTPQG